MYAQLDSPLPGLTVNSDGERCCGMRGYTPGMLGDDSVPVDTTGTYDTGTLVDPNAPISFSPVDLSTLPANTITPSLESMYPATIGTEFTSNGDGTYTNIQTGQSVPYDTAAAITQATTGPATVNLSTVATEGNLTLVDPTTGAATTINTNNLSAAAQALNAAGGLVTAAGKLTAQGQALLNAGNLYNPVPASAGISGAMASLTSWFTGSTMIAGVPNVAVAVGVIALVMVLPAMMSGKKRRR
jgi:hypothetical protein